MTVTQKYEPLAATAPDTAIQATGDVGERLPHALNALYEALRDSTAPGASAQLFMGHDHEYEGGWPISKGGIFSVDTGDEPFISLASGQGNTLGYMPVSPGFGERNGEVLVLFRYKVYGGDKWRLSFGRDWVELESFDEADAPKWAVATGPSRALHGWQIAAVGVQRDGATSGATCYLYGVHFFETANTLRQVGQDVETMGSSTNYAYWGSDQRLDDILFQSGDWLDANTLLWLEECINALREHTDNRKRPGSTTQYIKGHDHNPSSQGGRPVPRGMVFSAADWRDRLFSLTTGTAGTWHYIDEGAGGSRRTDAGSTVAGTPTTEPHFKGPVSPGFTSSGSPPASAPYLTGWVYLYVASGSPTFSVRIRELVSAAVSDTTAGATSGWVFIDKIPCTEDQWNDFVLEITCTSDNNVTVQLKAVMIAELGYHADTACTYVSSSGTQILASANKRR